MKIGKFDVMEYGVPVAGRVLRILGPRDPWAVFSDPEADKRNRADGYSPYWTTPWPGAVMLSEYVLEHVKPNGGLVLEIGAGLGLVGLALAANGFRMVVTDYDEDALEFARANAALNGVTFEDVRRLDWRKPPTEKYALIVGSDVCYEKKDHASIVGLLRASLVQGGKAVISDPHRSAADELAGLVIEAGFSFESVDVKGRPIPRPDATDGRVLRGRIFLVGR